MTEQRAVADRPRQPAETGREPVVALPTAALLIAVMATCALAAGGWMGSVALGLFGLDSAPITLRSGLLGVGLVMGVAVMGVLLLGPWKARAASMWMTLWMAGTVFRLLGTPVIAFVLHSAMGEALATRPFVMMVALAYVLTLLIETVIVAAHVNRRIIDPPSTGGR